MLSALGIGLVYWPALDPLVRNDATLASVVEIEPQAFWQKQRRADASWHYRCEDAVVSRLRELPQTKLLHGVDHPLGGSVRDPIPYIDLLRLMAQELKPAWVSEHLSFNRVSGSDGQVTHAGFLLPPKQTPSAVRVSAHHIRTMREALRCPIAFETGVSYVKAQPDELDDGAFFSAVAESADSGILLDLHNLWCNACNGRKHVDEVMRALPLERVWEIHLAGGSRGHGFQLDSHDGRIPDAVMELAARWIPRLPSLSAIVFEILPEHVPRCGLDGVARELERLKTLWALRASQVVVPTRRFGANEGRIHPTEGELAADYAEVAASERALFQRIMSSSVDGAVASGDAGYALFARLRRDARRASLTSALRLSLTLLLQSLDGHHLEALLQAYERAHPSDPHASVEADAFACFLKERLTELANVPHLAEVLAFEHALIRAKLYGEASLLNWSVDPSALLEALNMGRKPQSLPPTFSVMHVQPHL